MQNRLYYLPFFSTLLLLFLLTIHGKLAQAREIVFNQQKCVQSFVSQGLTTDKAKIWCNHKQDCLQASAQQGLPSDAAQSVCDCSINEFKKRYTVQEFQSLSQQAPNNPSIQAKLQEIGEACFDSILFEE